MLGVRAVAPCCSPPLGNLRLVQRIACSHGSARPQPYPHAALLAACSHHRSSNAWGQLGRGDVSTNLTETMEPAYIDVPADVKFESVGACNVHTVAVARSGEIYCFGCAVGGWLPGNQCMRSVARQKQLSCGGHVGGTALLPLRHCHQRPRCAAERTW